MTKNKVSSLFRTFHPIVDVLVGVMAGWLVGEIGIFRHFAQYLTNPLVFGGRCGVAWWVRFSDQLGGAAKVLNSVLEDEVSAIRPIGIRTHAIFGYFPLEFELSQRL